MKILVINAGSSSLKFRLFNMPGEILLCAGIAERIGEERAYIHFTIGENREIKELHLPVGDHTEAVKQVVALLGHRDNGILKDLSEIETVSHRIVHGGEFFSAATPITKDVKKKIRELFPFAPLHNPVGFRCIEVTEELLPRAKQVAVFDTAFYHPLPEVAVRYALPTSYYKNEKIRVYGFHGISHKYVTGKATEYLKHPDAKMISLHLGNGCSITAVKGSRPLDTSMGFSPMSGLVMGTRAGDIDASAILHLQTQCRLSAGDVETLLNKESGLLGLSGHSDMREVHKAAAKGDKEALFACELYVYRLKKYIGAYSAVLNGMDALIFTAGVGENDTIIRGMVCQGLDFLGFSLNEQSNKQDNGGLREINNSGSKIKILVIPTNEEVEMARQSYFEGLA